MSTEVQPNFPVTDTSQGSQPPETPGMAPMTSGREDAPAAPWQPESAAFDRHELREPMTTILPVDNAELARMTDYLASGLPAIDEYHDFLDSNNHERFRVVQGRGLDVATGAELDAPLVEQFNQVAAPEHYLLTEFQADDRRRLAGIDPLTTPMDEIIRYAHRDIEGFTQAAINIKAAEPNIQPEELDYRAALEVTEEMAREARHALELDAALRSWGYDDA